MSDVQLPHCSIVCFDSRTRNPQAGACSLAEFSIAADKTTSQHKMFQRDVPAMTNPLSRTIRY